MVIKVMRWGLRANGSKKYQVNIVLHGVDGLNAPQGAEEQTRLLVNLRWKGPGTALGSRLKGRKSSWTSSVLLGPSGAVEWQEDFENICGFTMTKEGTFQPWPVSFSLCKTVPSILKAKPSVLGSIPLDLCELLSDTVKTSDIMKLPVPCSFGGSEIEATFSISVKFVEIRTVMFDGLESVHRLVAPAKACMGEAMWDSDDGKPTDVVRKKGRGLKGIIPSIKSMKRPSSEEERHDGGKLSPGSEGKLSPRSVESPTDSVTPYDSDEVDDSDEDFEQAGAVVKLQKQFSYGTLAGANLVVEGAIPFHQEGNGTPVPGDVISIHSRASSLAFTRAVVGEEASSSTDSEAAPSSQGSLIGLFPWRKRKLSFRSPRARGEPLLNKSYGEEGGDEIDWDRRQSESGSPNNHPALNKYKGGEGLSATSSTVSAEVLDFGDELTFTVGSWETKELVSRDGQMTLSANVFFASFDQRSESAAGESACTALVAVVADWLHSHPTLMPSKAEFDMLIRDGSAEWRKLCEVEAYKDSFPDRHFDLDTILQAKVRPLSVVPEKSFIGFFQPGGLGASCDFLEGAMSFDGIWDEIERCGPAVYIVSWNDHFFVLRVEEHSCYIIDTLGERLYEGCNQAYILHFDDRTSLCNVPVKQTKDTKVVSDEAAGSDDASSDKIEKNRHSEVGVGALESASEGNIAECTSGDTVHVGRAACREFIKGFFAALPLRELQIDVKKGLLGKAPLHHRLQIEFHYAKALPSFPTPSMLGLSF